MVANLGNQTSDETVGADAGAGTIVDNVGLVRVVIRVGRVPWRVMGVGMIISAQI